MVRYYKTHELQKSGWILKVSDDKLFGEVVYSKGDFQFYIKGRTMKNIWLNNELDDSYIEITEEEALAWMV